MALIPTERLVDWTPGVRTGVVSGIGGLDQYYPGGVSERTDLINVKNAPYYAAGVNTETTGSITSGDDELTVADPSGWSFGNHIRVVLPAIHSFVVDTGSTETGRFVMNTPLVNDDYQSQYIDVTSGETATQVATKIRAATYKCWVTSGSGTTVIFTQKDYIPINASQVNINPGAPGTTAPSVTGTNTITQYGTIAVPSTTTVASIAGNVITLSANASGTVSGAIVQHDDAPSIQAAIAVYDLDGNQGVYLPAGEYRIYDTVGAGNLGFLLNDRTIRGELNPDGSWATKIDQRTGGGLILGTSSGPAVPAVTPVTVASGLAKGATSITLAATAGDYGDLAANKLMIIYVERDETLPVVSTYGYNVYVPTDASPVKQMVKISTINTGTGVVTFFPPLFDDYGGGSLDTVIFRITFPAYRSGIEDLEIDSANYFPGAFNNIHMGGCDNSWIRNCKISHARNYPISASYNLNCEIRHNFISGPENAGSNGGGILFDGHSCLVVDNIVRDSFPEVEVNGGSSGNAFLYNYGATAGDGQAWNINHAPHNMYNLYEGNCVGHIISDGYFGGSQYDTIFRNYFFNPYGINAKRWAYDMSAVGNFVPQHTNPAEAGYPNIGNGSKDGEVTYSLGEVWRDWKRTWEITTRTDDRNGVITNVDASGLGILYVGQEIRLQWADPADVTSARVTAVNEDGDVATILTPSSNPALNILPAVNTQGIVWAGSIFVGLNPDLSSQGSYQEQDLDVGNTMVMKGNYSRATGTIDNPTAPDTVPDSLAYSGEPDWWPDGFTWPPYDTTDVATQERERIPAAYRFINGEDPDPEPGGELTCTTFNVTTLTIG